MRTPVNPIASAGVHASEAAGRPPFVIRELLKAGLLHRDILTVAGDDLGAYGRMPEMDGDTLIWRDLPDTPIDDRIVLTVAAPFQPEGCIPTLARHIGTARLKISALDEDDWTTEAPPRLCRESGPD